jgi:hypothetical protein
MIDVRFAFKPLIVFASFCGFLTSGCATGHRIPEPPGVHLNEPHISWSIHAGTSENPEQLLVCDSGSKAECVVGASRPEREVFATLHLYLHPASVETPYTGTVQIGFFGGDRRAHQLDVKQTVKPGENPRVSTIYDLLPTVAGTYPMEIAVTATPASGEPREIRENVTVTVK